VLKARGYEAGSIKELSDFKDAGSIPVGARKDAAFAVRLGIIKGSNGSFNPNGKATRAEMTVMLYRLLQKL
jgi:hypothetical protein